jgi:hypothetical protein
VFESKFFEKKEYAKAMTDGFLTLDKELSEGKHLLKTKKSIHDIHVKKKENTSSTFLFFM